MFHLLLHETTGAVHRHAIILNTIRIVLVICLALVVGAPATAEAPQTDRTPLWSENYVVAGTIPNLVNQSRMRTSYTPYSCISYAKSKRPEFTEPWGYPNRVQVYDIAPSVGLIVFTTEGSVGHVAYVESVNDNTITVSEANYIPGKVTQRDIPIDSPIIRGYR